MRQYIQLIGSTAALPSGAAETAPTPLDATPAVCHQQQGALALAQRALAALEFVACLVGLGGKHGATAFGDRGLKHRCKR